MPVTQRKIADSLTSLETNVSWIRESLGRIEARAAEDRGAMQDHVEQDLAQFSVLHSRLNRLLGGLSLLGVLAGGLGFPWLLGLLGG